MTSNYIKKLYDYVSPIQDKIKFCKGSMIICIVIDLALVLAMIFVNENKAYFFLVLFFMLIMHIIIGLNAMKYTKKKSNIMFEILILEEYINDLELSEEEIQTLDEILEGMDKEKCDFKVEKEKIFVTFDKKFIVTMRKHKNAGRLFEMCRADRIDLVKTSETNGEVEITFFSNGNEEEPIIDFNIANAVNGIEEINMLLNKNYSGIKFEKE